MFKPFLDDQVQIHSTNIREDDVKKAVGHLDSWFIRSPWVIKRDYLFKMLDCVSNRGLEQIVNLLGPPVKDYNYSVASYMNYPSDSSPQDNYRQLDVQALKQAQCLSLSWLHSLPEQQIVNIIVGLTELGHNSLSMQVYNRSNKLMWDKRFSVVEEPKQDEEWRHYKVISDSVNVHSEIYRTYIATFDQYNIFMSKLQKKINTKNDEVNVALPVKNGRGKKGKEDETNFPIDYIQLLPSWINKMIFSYLDDKTLSVCDKVNPYWKKIVKDFKMDMQVRTSLNSLINRFPMFDPDSLEKWSRRKSKTLGKTRIKLRKFNITNQDVDKESLLQKLKMDQRGKTFMTTHEIIWTLNEYSTKRIVTVGKKWLAISQADEILLYNLPNYTSSPGSIKGHDGSVTAMAFHPEEATIVSAGNDSTIRIWETWSRREINQIKMANVKQIVANNIFFVVDGTNVIKAFQWNKDKCLWSVDIGQPDFIKSIDLSPIGYAVYVCTGLNTDIISYCGCNGKILAEIYNESPTRISCMRSMGNYLAKAMEDGWIEILHVNDANDYLVIAQRNFHKMVMELLFVNGHLMALDTRGSLHLWNPVTDQMVLSLAVGDDSTHMFSLHLLYHCDCCEVLINSERNVKVVKLTYATKQPRPDLQGKQPKKTDYKKGVLTLKRQEAKINQMHMIRQSCHPNLRRDLECMRKNKIQRESKQEESQMKENPGGVESFKVLYENDHTPT